MNCLDDKTLSSYLDKKLSDAERQNIEAHISECNHCLELLLVAYEAQHGFKKPPPLLKEKIRKKLGLSQKKKQQELKWLFSALALFILSFVFRRFFLQFLVAAGILGFKWVMEGEGAKRVIMIFKDMQKEEKKVERKSTPPVSNYRRR